MFDHLQHGITEDERRDIQAVLRAPTADHSTQTTGGDVTMQTPPSRGLLIGAYGLHISLDPGTRQYLSEHVRRQPRCAGPECKP